MPSKSSAVSPPPLAGQLSAIATLAATPFASLDDAIDAALTLLSNLTGFKLTMIHRLEGDDLVVSHACDRVGLGVTPPVVVPRRATFCDDVLASLAPLIVPDADADPVRSTLPGKLMVGTRTYIGVPIVLGDGHLFGTLCAHDRRVLRLSGDEADAMRIVARLIASHIERERTLADQQDAAARLGARNAEVATAYQEIQALREVVESISSELDLPALLERIVASAVALLGAHAGAISLCGSDPEAPRRLVATHNLHVPDLEARGVPSQSGLMGQVLVRRAPVIVERYADIASPLPDAAFHALAPWVAVPIWRQGEIIGTFGVAGNDPGRRFGEHEVELLTLLAKHAAIAIENARLFAASRELGVAEERNRLAHEIHDTLAQSLLTLTFQIRAARAALSIDPERAAAELADAEVVTRSALEEARRSVWNLGPAALDGGTLVDALRAEAGSGRAGGPCRFVVEGTPRPLPAGAQLALLRTVQEALANARRYAAAASVEVALAFDDRGACVRVADDGRGFDLDAVRAAGPTVAGGSGLVGLRDRLGRLGGRLEVLSAPGRGTRIDAWVPYAVDPQPRLPSVPAPHSPGPRVRPAIRAVVADDHPVVRAGLVALLKSARDIEVVGEAETGEDALDLVKELRPDLLLIDLRLPGLDGIAAIERLRQIGVTTRTLVVTSFAQDDLVLRALAAGAQGYVLKAADPTELLTAARAVGRGGTYFVTPVAAVLARGLANPTRLTARERQVLQLLGRGLADKEIADHLGTSVKTARYHVANLLSKLGAHNRTDAVRLALERGLIEVS